ncbi:SRPBCC family protein [bacterium]|nr:SRPBCC family protein [bacterium]
MKKIFIIISAIIGVALVIFFSLGVANPKLTFTVSVQIDQPITVVWEKFADENNMQHWMQGFKKIENVSGNPGEVGSKFRLTFDENGEEVYVDEELLVLAEKEKFAFSMDNEVLNGKGEFTFKAIDSNRTEMIYHNESEGKGLFWKSLLFLAQQQIIERNQNNFSAFKNFSESK